MRQLVYKDWKTLCWSWVGRKKERKERRGRKNHTRHRAGAMVLRARSKEALKGGKLYMNTGLEREGGGSI